MRFPAFTLALVCACPFVATAQQKPAAPPTGFATGDWKADGRSPLKFAQLGDSGMAAFRGIEGHTTTELEYDGHGHSLGEIEMRTPTVFSYTYAWMHYPGWAKSDYPISKVFVKSNGKLVDTVFGADSRHLQVPALSYRFNEASSIQDWVFGFSRYILGAFHGERPLASLVSMALRSPSDYKVTVWRRTGTAYGQPTSQIRTVIYRVPAAAKRFGPLKIELICDEKTGVPVTIETSAAEPQRKPIHAQWMAAFRKHSFPDADFTFGPLKKKK